MERTQQVYDRNEVSPLFARQILGGRGLSLVGRVDEMQPSSRRDYRLATGNVAVLLGRMRSRHEKIERLVKNGAPVSDLREAVDAYVDDSFPITDQLLSQYARVEEHG
jgi:hypothetical protein